jgi:SAM-dependent methyltransferase
VLARRPTRSRVIHITRQLIRLALVNERLWQRLRYVAKSGLRRRLRDVLVGVGGHDRFVVREDIARRYLEGNGIEIGAFTWPLRVPPGVVVRYVDQLDREALLRAYGSRIAGMGLDPASVPNTDVVDEAERLSKFPNESVDFVIANHVLEHIEDPITALHSFLRVVRPGGVLLVVLPDPRHTFDALRPRTTVEHVLIDHQEGPSVSRRGHYEEWARFNERLPEDLILARVSEFEREDARHHFHVWELRDFLKLLLSLDLPAELELAQANNEEFALVLRKTLTTDQRVQTTTPSATSPPA